MQLTFEAAGYPQASTQNHINELMRKFQTVKRIAFNRLLEGQARQSIVETIRELAILSNARYVRSAIEEAKSVIQSQHELVKLYYREYAWNYKLALKDLKEYQQQLKKQKYPLKVKQQRKHERLQRRVLRMTENQAYWGDHKKHKTFPKVIFGGKKRFKDLQEGKITKKEWQQARSNGLYCVGEKSRKGNANLRIHYNKLLDQFSFSVLLDSEKKGQRLTAPLYVPVVYRQLFQLLARGRQTYIIRLQWAEDRTHIRVLVSTDHPNLAVPNGKGMAGIDLNPTGIAVTIVSPDGNFRRSKWFFCPDLIYARKNKRNWLLGNLIKEVFDWITTQGINTIGLEDLNFSKKYGASRKFNRVRSNFVYKRLINAIYSRAIKMQVAIQEVNPAYTSQIGEVKYSRRYGLNSHQAAALVIARRALYFSEKLQFYDHVNHFKRTLVVPPMEGWNSRQISLMSRDIVEFTARLSTPTVRHSPIKLQMKTGAKA
ncbi:MAG: IS200/IS605 family accessory protein TnpB-related protein [Candidatus Hodarchaeota archaeon]